VSLPGDSQRAAFIRAPAGRWVTPKAMTMPRKKIYTEADDHVLTGEKFDALWIKAPGEAAILMEG